MTLIHSSSINQFYAQNFARFLALTLLVINIEYGTYNAEEGGTLSVREKQKATPGADR